MRGYLSKLYCLKGGGSLSAQITGEGGRPPTTTNDFWRQSPRALMWRCLRDPMFSRFDTIPACDRHTKRQTDRHTMTANTRASLAPRGYNN